MKRILFIHVLALFCALQTQAQNSFNSGDGWGAGWGTGAAMSASAGSSLIYTTTNTLGGNVARYFRFFGNGTPCGEYQPNNGGLDLQLTVDATYTSANMQCGSTKAFYVTVPNTTDNWVFKSAGVSAQQIVVFRVQGPVRTISSVAQAPVSASVFPGQAVTVTATMSSTQSTGQNVYLRYSTDNFATSTVTTMTYSGSSATATIPAASNTPGATVRYYVFTSGAANVAANGSNADFYTINLNNNAGSNYSYTVAGGWTTAATGNWGTAATWTANAIPPTATSMGLVTINHAVTQDVAALASSINISGTGTLTATANTLTISNNTTGTTFTNTGTMALSSTHAVTFAGTATHTISGTCTFNNINTTTGINYGTSSTVNGTFTINAGGFVSTNAPTYGASSTLTYNTGAAYAASTEWTANALTGQGVPNNVTISTAATSVNFGASTQYRRLRGNLTISASTTFALSTAVGGDLRVGGNWTNSGTFTANSRAVYFDGSAGQTINATATGFAYLFISNTSATVTAAAAITVANSLTIDANARLDMAANTLTLTGSTSTVNGFLRSAGTITGATTTSLTFSSTGTYEHNFTGATGTIPTSTWSAGSTCAIIGYTSTAVTINSSYGQAFSNFTWNCTGQSVSINLLGLLTTVNGNFNLASTGTGSVTYNTNSPTAPTLTIGGNCTINANINVNNGTSTPTFLIAGNFSHTGGTISKAGAGVTTVTFNKASGTQTITQSGGSITGVIVWNAGNGTTTNTVQLASNLNLGTGAFTFNSAANATTDFQTYVISGSGTSTAATGATLLTANTAGINTSGATGSVQTTTRTFTNTGVNYTFNGGSAQSAGTAIGAAASIANLTVNNSAGVTLSSNVQSLTGTLTLTSGNLSLITFDLNLASTATISGASTSKYVVTGSTGQLKRAALTTAFTFPVGNSAYNPITITNTGTSDTYGVIVSDGAIPDATVSSAAVNRRWIVTEGTAGGGNLAVTAQYNTGETGGTYTTGSQVYVGLYVPTTWTTTTTTVSGSNPFTAAGSGFTQTLPTSGTTAYFAIGNDGMSLAIPTVTTTTTASSITNNAASTGGQTITGSSLTAKGVVYSTAAVTTTPTLSNSVLTDGSTTTANFTSSLTSLNPQTQYYVRAYATNAAGTGYASAINFYTLSNPATAQASGLSATATAPGTLNVSWTGASWPASGAAKAGYVLIYSTGTPTLSSTNGTAPAAGVGTLVTITPAGLPATPATSQLIGSLTGGTTYNILLVPFTWDGVNAATYNYFTASAPTTSAVAIGNPAITTTTAISSIANTSASSGGSGISANGGSISAKGVVWNTSTSPTTANSSTNDGTGTSSFSSTLSSLSAQTLYYVRAYATNDVGTAYGNELSFRTLSNPATAQASSLSATASASGQLTLNWTGATYPSSGATQGGYALIYSTATPTLVSANGSAPAAGVGTLITISPTNLPSAPATSYVLSGLTGGVTYNFLLVPFTWDGTNAVTYSYLTASAPTAAGTAVTTASVTTTAVSGIGSASASSGGSSINSGGGTISAKGVVWNTATAPTTSNNSTNDGTGTTDYGSSLTSLSPQTFYYYRAYVTNDISTAYGSESSFYTLSNEPTAAASSFTATANGSSQIDLAWTAATFPGSGATNNGYIILRRVDSTNPTTSGVTDGVNPASLSLPAGTTLVTTITSGATASYSHTGLFASTQYNYIIIPFTWDGTNASTYNYYLTSAPNANDTTAAGLPSIDITTAATSITNNSASSGGSTLIAGGSGITAKGVAYNTTGTPTISDNTTNDGSGTANFTSSLTGLSGQTLYYVRAYVTNTAGTAYGNEITFRTLSNPASAQASGLTATASASGELTINWSGATFPSSGATQGGYALIYSTGTPTLSSANATAPAAGVGTLVTITPTNLPTAPSTSYVLSGLTAGTTYNFLLVPFTWNGTNANTYNYLTASAPTTSGAAVAPASVSTTAITSITTSSAVSGGSSITAGGGTISAKGVAWNTATAPTTANSTTNNGTGTTSYSSSLTSLSAQTLYYARAYVTNEIGTVYGNETTFRTLSNPATAQATALSASNSASGELTLSWTGATFPSSGATQGGYALIYSTSTPTLSSSNGSVPSAGVGTLVTISATTLPTTPTTSYVLTGLTGGTTYNFLLVPFTWDGTNASTYNYLTTSAPTTTGTAVTNGSVTTTAASAITNTSASSGGSSIGAGGGSISAKGVVWNTSTAPTTANNSTNDGTGTSSFSSSLTSLNAQTLYYYRAYATNDVGTVYGSESSFYTLSNAPTAQASGLSASATSSSNINLTWSAATFPASGATTTGYVLLRATSPNTPSLGNGNGATPTAGANTTIVSSSIAGVSTSASSGTLAAATTYNYLLVPFTWDGVNVATYNYLTSSAPTASATTLATSPSAQPTTLVFSAVTASTITASWTAATGSPAGYIVLRSTSVTPNTDPVAGTVYSAGNTLGNATVVYAGSALTTGSQTGLVDGTTFYYKVFSYNGSSSTINYFTTSPLSGTQATTAISAPVAIAATSAASSSFTANWGAVSGASSYLLDVSTNPCFALFGSSSTAAEGFAGGTTAPSGWTFTAIGATYTTAGNFGAASPSLTMDATGDRVLTNQLSGAAASQLSFWLKGNGTNSLSALLVEGTTDGTNWVTIENITNSIPTTGTTKTYNFTSTPLLPCGMIQFRFTYTKNAGNLAFDDVSITSASSTPDFVSGYNGLSVSGTSSSVTGLASSTTYYYRVRSVGTNSTSGNSNVITAATLNDPNTADYRSVASGNYTSSSTWEYNSIGSTWVAATQAPTSASNVNIQAAHTVTLDASRSIDSGKTLTIAGVLDAGANNISGAGVVAMAGTSTIITSSASGLAGVLQMTTPSSCTFATGAKFHFTGTAVNTGFASFTGVGSFTFYNLVWAGTTSITLDKNIRITTLDFTNDGLFYLGNFDLYISSSGVINGSPFSSSKMFVTDGTGSLFRFITTGVWTAFTWPIGETSGTADYSPVTINALTGNAAASAYIGFRVTDSAEPNNGLASNYITRYWTYTTANLTAGSSWSNTTFGYTASDIVGTETLLKANVYNAATTTWTEFSTSSAASNTLTFTSGASTTTVLTTNTITARVDPPLYYRSASSGSWGAASTWLVSTDASFVSPAGITATSAPTAANSIGITILAGHSITSSTSVSADQLTIQTGGSLEMTNNALTISNGTGTDVTVETGATLLLSGTSTMTINTSAALQVDGLYKVSSTSAPVVTTSGTTTIGATGTYEHARDAGIVPTCTWTTGSTCLITGTGNNAPTGLAQSFHHFTVNTTLTNSVNCSGLLQTVNGKLKITTNDASFGWRLTGTTNYTLNVADSLIITNGILDVASGGATGTINANGPIVINGSSSQLTKTGAAAMVINCNSNLVQNAGIIEFNAGGSSNTTWNIKGDFVQGGTIQRTNGGTHTLNFNKASGTQTWTQTGSFGTGALIINVGNSTTNTVQLLSNISLGASAHTFNVTNGATFNMGPYTLSGAASGFVLGATGAIKLGNANGIVTAPTASGNVQTSTRTFPATASYFYNGTANQVTGNALPATLTTTGNLNIEAASGVMVTLTTNNTTVPTFNLLSGLFAAGIGQNINLSNGGVVNATGGDFATGASAGNITATGSAAFNGNCNPYNVYASGGVNFGAQTVSIQNGGTFRINAGGFVNTNAPFYSTGATLQYNSSATYGRALEWSATSGRGYPHHVQISNNTILDPANTAGAQANTPLRTAGNLTVDSGSALYMDFGGNNMNEDLVVSGNLVLTGALSGSQASGSDIFVGGNWQNNGTSTNFYPNNRAVFFNGTGTQTISGTNSSFPAFPYLFIDKTAGAVSLSRDIQVTESLTFSSANTANIEANGFTVYVSKNTTTAIDRQGSGHVVGNLRRAVTTGTNTYAFPIGGTTAYAPVSMALNNVTVAGSLTLATTAGDHPQISTSGIDASKSVNRYYTITNTGVTLTSYNPTFTFVAGDLDASVNTSNLLVGRYNAGWTYPAIGTRTATSTQATTVTSFGDFAIAECKSPAAFNITGGGDYCSGGAGVAVGLDGSESWVNYQLQRDGVDVGSPVAGTGSALSFGNQTAGGVYTVVALNASSSSCSTAQTGTATISINPTVTPSVSIASTTSTSICSGSSVTFNATPQFGGTTPSYQWKLNGVNVGTNASTYTNGSLANNDVISCVMTSSEACPTSASVNSNTLTMTVLAYQTPTITVASTSGTTVCGGYEVIYTSSTTFAGLTPAYQWKINGVNAGGNSDTFSSTTLSSGDQVSCVLTSDYQCLTGNTASSNTLTMSVTAPPQVDAGSALSSCGTSPVVVSNGASVSSAVSYSWSENGAGSITSGGTTLTPTYTPAAGDVGTTVTLTLTANGNSPCAAVSDVVSVSITPLILFYVDADGDGFGNPLLAPVAACTAPVGRVANNTDCCDSNADVNPATEWWADVDGDGFGSFVANGGCISGCSGEAQNIPYYPAAHGGAAYTADCNDANITAYPGANELCQNSSDDDCDGLIDEGCSGILNDTYANAVLTNTTNPNAIFPNCLVYNGTNLNADISPQSNPANVAVGGGRDVWYRFVAPSTAVRIRVVPVGFDAVVELRTAMPSNTQVDVENANATIGGVEILNKGGLTAGQTYYVAVRNYNATAGGSFTICISPLMPSGCAYVVPTGGFSLCSTFKANYRGATSYTFNFTGTGGNAAFPYVTTSASSTGLIALNTPALDLRNSGVYSCRVDANYILQDGAGATEPVITVLGSTTSSNCTGITISAQPQMVVRSNQVCPAVLSRSTFLVAVATDGSSQACGAINYTYRFTQVTDCSGATTSGLPFTVNTTGTTPYLSLAAAFPASSGYPLASVGYWKVEVRPNFSYGAGTFGPSRIISVNNTSSTMAMDTEGFADSERSGDSLNSSLGWNIYPNPSDGRSLQLESPEESVIQMRIHNAVGALVYDAQISMQAQQPARVDFAQPLPAGVYLIELTTSNQTQTLRWVVE